MHDLKPSSSLNGMSEQAGGISITENAGVALASVAARRGHEAACAKTLEQILGDVPGPGRAQLNDPEAGFWIGPDQWMIGAPFGTHEDLADQLKSTLGNSASVTEQTGAWVVIDVSGSTWAAMFERLCPLDCRNMMAGDARRTTIHQIGCFMIKREAEDHVRILGPRASATSLHHALVGAARSVSLPNRENV